MFSSQFAGFPLLLLRSAGFLNVCQVVYSTLGCSHRGVWGQVFSLRTGFMSVLDPVVGLSTEVKQQDNDM